MVVKDRTDERRFTRATIFTAGCRHGRYFGGMVAITNIYFGHSRGRLPSISVLIRGVSLSNHKSSVIETWERKLCPRILENIASALSSPCDKGTCHYQAA